MAAMTSEARVSVLTAVLVRQRGAAVFQVDCSKQQHMQHHQQTTAHAGNHHRAGLANKGLPTVSHQPATTANQVQGM
jgi:hypothetical protein